VTEIIPASLYRKLDRALNGFALALRRSPAPLALMIVIFWLSAQPNLDSGLGLWDDILRKLAHVTAYAGLTLLWAWSLRPVLDRPLPVAAALTLLYAISDEFHQSFVEGRTGSPIDVGIDLIGVMCASILLRYDRRFRSVPEGGSGDSEEEFPKGSREDS
jgi:VanZ like family